MSEETVDPPAASELTTHEDGRITFQLFTESATPLAVGAVRLELMDVSEGEAGALVASVDVRAGEDSGGLEVAVGQTVDLPGGGAITLDGAESAPSDDAPERFVARFTVRPAA